MRAEIKGLITGLMIYVSSDTYACSQIDMPGYSIESMSPLKLICIGAGISAILARY